MSSSNIKIATSPIKKSFIILHSSLFSVLTIYMINVIFAKLVYLKLGILAAAFILPLKVFVHGGVYGMLVELVSGEELVLRFSRFTFNAKKYWKYYLYVMAAPISVYFLLKISNLIDVRMDVFSFIAFINPLLLFLLAIIIVKDKYINSLKLENRAVSLNFPIIAMMLGLFIAGFSFFRLPYIFWFLDFELARITDFFYNYINLLTFSYFACLAIERYPEIQESFSNEKEIYLINPPGGGILFHISSFVLRDYPPVFVVIKALTPKGYKFREFNRIPWKNRYYASGKLVAMTCFTSNCIDVYRMAREFKKHGSKVIIGGPHVTYLPDEALEYCDSVVCGELESVWPKVIEDYENDALKEKYVGDPLDDCHQLVYQELLNSPPEIVKDFLETSRGCKFKCHFCTVPALSHGKLRKQKISDFIELVKKVKQKYNHVLLIDNNIYSDPAYTKELFRALKSVNIKWSSQSSIDIAKNKEILRLAKESGCRRLLIGFEISEGSFEKKQGGKLALVDYYKDYAREIRKMGIGIKAHFIFGFESDELQHLFKFWKFCFSIRPFATILSILTPFPGSRFYYDMIEQDRISNLNWRHYGGQTLVFNHPRMNNAILSKIYPLFFLIFLLTTSKFGYGLLLLTAIIISIRSFI